MRLLYVEDEEDIRTVTARRLAAEGYSVDTCADGQQAWDYLEVTHYDAVILDLMLPKLDGLTLLRRMREAGNAVPVLLLTARDAVEDRVAGLDAGADDYLVKPFAYDELSARVRVLLRRGPAEQITSVLTLDDLSMDLSAHQVTRGGQILALSAKEYAILEYMLRNKGVVLSRDRIEQHVWNYDFEGGSNVVDVYIRYLRRKIDAGFEKKLLHTVRGAGYVLRSEP